MMLRWALIRLLLVLLSTLRTTRSQDDGIGDDVAEGVSSGADFLPSFSLPTNDPLYRPPVASGHVYFAEPFRSKEDFLKRWTMSEVGADRVAAPSSKYEDLWRIEEMKRNSVRGDLGLVLKRSSKYHAISAGFDKPFESGNKPLVVQYEVKFQADHDCGGAYVKLLTKDDRLDLSKFSGQTPYTIMFGPDKCGEDEKIHFILRLQNPVTGQIEEKHCRPPSVKFGEIFTDKKIHLFTLGVYPNNSFEILLDQERINSGKLLDDKWETSLTGNPKCTLVDGCDLLSQPIVHHPTHRKDLKPSSGIDSDFEGKSFPEMIPNSGDVDDQETYRMPSIGAIGMELWSTSSNIFFDNFIVTDDKYVADQWADQGWKPKKTIEIANSKGLRGLMVYFYDSGLERRWLWGVYAFFFLLPFVLVSVVLCPESGPLFKASMIANALRPGEEREEEKKDEAEAAKRKKRKKEKAERNKTLDENEEMSADQLKDKILDDNKVEDGAVDESSRDTGDAGGSDSSDSTEASHQQSRRKVRRRRRRN